MGNGRPISNQRRFQSCLYDKDVVTTHDVGTTHVVYRALYSECDNENNQSTHMCMNRTKKYLMEAAFNYYSCLGAKKKRLRFIGQKHRSRRAFLRRFNIYLVPGSCFVPMPTGVPVPVFGTCPKVNT